MLFAQGARAAYLYCTVYTVYNNRVGQLSVIKMYSTIACVEALETSLKTNQQFCFAYLKFPDHFYWHKNFRSDT